MQIRQRKSRVPVVGVDDVRHEGRDYPKANIGGDSRQRRKAQRVVRPIHAVRLEIRVSRTREQVRRIENKQAEFTVALVVAGAAAGYGFRERDYSY
jgi:hypothetical protein